MSNHSIQQEVDERSNLTSSNKFEMLLFRLGKARADAQSELFGINVFKIREIVAMPEITAMSGTNPHMLGIVNLRGQIIPVIDLPAVIGCTPTSGLNIMLVTEFARTTQAFAVESVEDIVRLDWGQVLPAERGSSGAKVTSIARLDGDVNNSRLAQVLDVESILGEVMPSQDGEVDVASVGQVIKLKPGTMVLAADDSFVARSLIEQGLHAMGVPFIMTKSGQEAWTKLQTISDDAESKGQHITDRIAMVLTDLEMPEMDGFTLTRNIKQDPRFRNLPVIIHSSLSGSTNEDHVRSVGADGYVAKFQADELAAAIRGVLVRYEHR
ncbi:MAG: chemotaxis protein [Burkholderiaceae bacterium]|jgi:two-component system chemotaxis response regulator CheV|nr:chemotaxis protein [Burkholderiaceae bacterium]MDP3424092.1 chemotaxis protein [Burkholderiaceae bacterium]MDZ4163314.1 chemotaxis protein [Burkholderiales bacterium]